MADDPRDVYLFTITTTVTLTFDSAEDVRAAALAKLDSPACAYMLDDHRERERAAVGRSIDNALTVLIEPDAMVAAIPGTNPRKTRIVVQAGPPPES